MEEAIMEPMLESAAKSELEEKQHLRRYGLTMGGVISVLFGLVLPTLFHRPQYPRWPWVLAGFFWALALLRPLALSVIERAWMTFGEKMGAINSFLIMGITYWTIIVPLGLVMRLLSKTSVDCRLEKNRRSYRILAEREISASQMEHPF